jgi:SAM-dependent methyltransferase
VPTPRPDARTLVARASYVVTGRGGAHLRRKEQYHRLRREAERAYLDRARVPDAGLSRPATCPVCGAPPTREPFRNRVGFTFGRCPEHDIVLMDPVPTDDALTELYNSEAERYHWVGHGDDELVIEHRDDLDALRRFLSGGVASADRPRLLEVGCATGGFLRGAREWFDVEGVELNEESAARARAAGFVVHTGRIADVPADRGSYDVIVAIQLVEHLPDPGDLLAEAHRLLRPGGALYLATPAVDSASFAALGADHTHVASFGHVVLFSRAGLTALAERHGFDVEHHEHYGGRDLALHDLATRRLAPTRFVHRMALYRTRLYYAGEMLDGLTGGRVLDRLAPAGPESYQRALLRRRA